MFLPLASDAKIFLNVKGRLVHVQMLRGEAAMLSGLAPSLWVCTADKSPLQITPNTDRQTDRPRAAKKLECSEKKTKENMCVCVCVWVHMQKLPAEVIATQTRGFEI